MRIPFTVSHSTHTFKSFYSATGAICRLIFSLNLLCVVQTVTCPQTKISPALNPRGSCCLPVTHGLSACRAQWRVSPLFTWQQCQYLVQSLFSSVLRHEICSLGKEVIRIVTIYNAHSRYYSYYFVTKNLSTKGIQWIAHLQLMGLVINQKKSYSHQKELKKRFWYGSGSVPYWLSVYQSARAIISFFCHWNMFTRFLVCNSSDINVHTRRADASSLTLLSSLRTQCSP